MTTEVEQQVAEEVSHLLLLDVLEVEMEVEVEPSTFGTDGDAGNNRDAITPVVMTQHRGLPDRSPTPGDRGGQEEAGFIGEDDVGTQPRSVFFTRGQSSRTKRRTSRSFRSKARFCGF